MSITRTYYPTGVCARQIDIALNGDKIESVSVIGGCEGYSLAIERLLPGMAAREAIQRLKGLPCGSKGTSCCDQITLALEEMLEEKE